MAHKRETLTDWIRDVLTDEERIEAGTKCTQIALVHLEGGGQREIHVTKFGGKSTTPEALGQMFETKARNYIQDMVGVQSFNLLAFYGSNQPETLKFFSLNPEGGTYGVGATEPPDERGQKQQGMRHGEMLMQQTYRKQEHLDKMMFQVLDRITGRLDTAEKEKHDAYEIVFKVMAEQATREHERRMAELQYERATQTQTKLIGMIPPLANQLTGKEIFPQSKADTELVEMIAESIDEETIALLASKVKPELIGPLAARLAQVVEKRNKEKAHKESVERALAQANPIDDAAGDANGTAEKAGLQ